MHIYFTITSCILLIILSVFLQFYIYLTYNLIYFYLLLLLLFLFFKHIGPSIGYLDVLLYVPIVYGFLPEINVFVFVFVYIYRIVQLKFAVPGLVTGKLLSGI